MVQCICRDCKKQILLWDSDLVNPKCPHCNSVDLDMGKISYGKYCPPGCEFKHD